MVRMRVMAACALAVAVLLGLVWSSSAEEALKVSSLEGRGATRETGRSCILAAPSRRVLACLRTRLHMNSGPAQHGRGGCTECALFVLPSPRS